MNEKEIAQFNSAGQWAIHFSTVRMTMTTFFIGISWGVISVKWDEFSLPLGISAIVVWVLAGTFLFLFTEATFEATKDQKKIKNLILIDGQSSEHKELRTKTAFLIWLPFWAFLALTVGFGFLYQQWATHVPQKKIVWTTMVEPSPVNSLVLTNVADADGVVFKFVDFSQPSSATNLQAVIDELQKIHSALSNTPAQLQTRETGLFFGIGRRELNSK